MTGPGSVDGGGDDAVRGGEMLWRRMCRSWSVCVKRIRELRKDLDEKSAGILKSRKERAVVFGVGLDTVARRRDEGGQ